MNKNHASEKMPRESDKESRSQTQLHSLIRTDRHRCFLPHGHAAPLHLKRRNTHEHRLGSCTAPLQRRSAFVLVTTRQSSNRAPSPFTATRNESSRAPSLLFTVTRQTSSRVPFHGHEIPEQAFNFPAFTKAVS